MLAHARYLVSLVNVLSVMLFIVLYQFLVQFQRRNRIYKEEQRKIRAAARKGNEGEGGGVNVH